MTARREFLLMLTAGLVAAAVLITPVIAEEFFGRIIKVDIDGKTLTVLKDGGDDIEIKTTDSTEISATKGEMDLEKLARFVKKQFGMELTFCILVPRAGTGRKAEVQSAPRARCA